MKLTTEQILAQLGITVGVEFRRNGTPTTVNQILSNGKLVVGAYEWSIDMLLNQEITHLPNYILTEDDKKLVTSIEMVGVYLKDQYVSRNSNGYLHLSVHEKNVLFLNKDFLKCIENNTSISLYDLREIAKR